MAGEGGHGREKLSSHGLGLGSPRHLLCYHPMKQTLSYLHFADEKMETRRVWGLPGSHCSVQFSRSVVSGFLPPHGLQHARLPCPSPTPRACSNTCPSSQWCHPNISSSVVPFSSCLQSLSASGSFPRSQFVTSGGQSHTAKEWQTQVTCSS